MDIKFDKALEKYIEELDVYLENFEKELLMKSKNIINFDCYEKIDKNFDIKEIISKEFFLIIEEKILKDIIEFIEKTKKSEDLYTCVNVEKDETLFLGLFIKRENGEIKCMQYDYQLYEKLKERGIMERIKTFIYNNVKKIFDR